jgi:putative copper export protein
VTGDSSFDRELAASLLTGTAWGWGWVAQVAGAALALGSTLAVARTPSSKRVGVADVVGALAVVVLAVAAAVSGHPAAAGQQFLAVSTDAVHVVAAGGWIGTLAFVAAVGIPATSAAASDERVSLVRDQITAFSRVALMCAGLVVLTGVVSSWIQLGSVAALWETEYGWTLLIKLAWVALVAAAGAYNWRVATPRLLAAGGVRRIRGVIAAELLFALFALTVTAVLVATPPPVDAMTDATQLPSP